MMPTPPDGLVWLVVTSPFDGAAGELGLYPEGTFLDSHGYAFGYGSAKPKGVSTARLARPVATPVLVLRKKHLRWAARMALREYERMEERRAHGELLAEAVHNRLPFW